MISSCLPLVTTTYAYVLPVRVNKRSHLRTELPTLAGLSDTPPPTGRTTSSLKEMTSHHLTGGPELSNLSPKLPLISSSFP
jgi:hypothetical protein